MMLLLPFLLATQTAGQEVPFTATPLNTVKIPQLLFFCTSKVGEPKLFALEVEHDPAADVIRIGRTPGRSELLFERPIAGAGKHINPEGMLVKLSSEDATQHSRADVLLTVAKTVTGEFNLTMPSASYSATCQNVPIPPHLKSGQ